MINKWKNKRILITGVCGTVGQELLRQLVELEPKEIIGIDNNETELFFLGERCKEHKQVTLFLGDLRDRDQLMRRMRGVDYVLHSAALKHVGLCEKSPSDAVQTNIIGTQNIIYAALYNKVDRVLYTSSDKAVNPTNVMGTSKLMGERLMTAASDVASQEGHTTFISTRFGNVLGSRGSVIPLFRKQIAAGGPVTLTNDQMTRFIMTLEEAARLVMESTFAGSGGDVLVTKMPSIYIKDLAEVMIEELAAQFGHKAEDIKLNIIGSKPGEKLYEELVNDEEVRRTRELDNYFLIEPAYKLTSGMTEVNDKGLSASYNSSESDKMSKEELRKYLLTHNLLSSNN